ncbi:hydrolase or acyltransferase [Cypionkella aquatica]|uniref:Hydrolase or acyltransferase n=1 Tax=Cypionkella aquatica TaxID=1756042 RepID=A0AA37TZL1_9RHOB|nr:alpha/beta hydrolase [Cypionkella aquatica]GLS85135.1 hydrolase or acyltransferase [Cypionkella aquatica]GLS86707.1 hydrolase or acyltransferase [Cypionkella aquatica]
MTWQKLAGKLLIAAALLGGVSGVTLYRAQSREAAILAEFPAQGQFLTVNGVQVHVYVTGAGPDLILIHGASGNARDLTVALAADLEKSYRVIAFDRPGLGWSDPIPDQSIRGQALHLADAAAQLNVHDPIIVGQSYGGSVTLAWALFAPLKPRALVLISAPSLPWPGPLDIFYRLSDSRIGAALIPPLAAAYVPDSFVDSSIAAVFSPDPVPPGYATAIAAKLALRRTTLRANFAQVNDLRPEIVAQEPLYPQLTLPIEMIHGTADTTVPLAIHSAPFAARMPNAHLTVLDGAGHMPHYSHRTAALAAIARAAQRSGLHSPPQSP